MQSKVEGKFVVARLKEGEDYLESLEKIAQKHNITSGVILNSIGMFSDVELGFFKGKGKYQINKFEGPLECVSVQGNISTMDNELKTHIHVTLSNEKSKAFAGHLEQATVAVTAEILILKLDQVDLTRSIEEETGLAGLNLK
jgi:uncharacterized protein